MREQLTTQLAGQMKTITTNFTDTNDRVLDTVVDTNRKAVKFAVKTADQVADRFEQAPALSIDLPFADRINDMIPTPAEAGDRYLDVVERLVEMNRDFSERVVSMLPIEDTKAVKKTVKTAAKNTKAAAKNTKKTATRKVAAKK